jgi:hypothetical protein
VTAGPAKYHDPTNMAMLMQTTSHGMAKMTLLTRQLMTIDTLRVGDFVKVQAIHLAGETSLHITMLEVMPPSADLAPSGNLRGASALGPP